jgi:hypothetical protein
MPSTLPVPHESRKRHNWDVLLLRGVKGRAGGPASVLTFDTFQQRKDGTKDV